MMKKKMTTQSYMLFDSTVRLFKSLGSNVDFENGIFRLSTETFLSKEQATLLRTLFDNKSLFRQFDLTLDWEKAESRQIIDGAECTELKIEFNLDKGNKFSFYKNEQDLFQKLSIFLIQGKSLPDNYFLIEEDYRSDSQLIHPSLIKLKSITEWFEFFKKTSDIDKKTDDGLALYYFIKGEDDKFAKPLEIRISNIEELIEIDKISPVGDIKKLILEDEHGNLHHRDRQSFFKLALVDTFRKLITTDTTGESNTVILFKSLDKVKKAYYDHYDVFIHNFAIGEFQQQVEEKGFDYAEKVSSVLNDIQIRLYAIPIVLVSLGALAKVDNIYSYLFIISGVIITALFNYWMINDQVLRLEQIKKSSSFTFDKLKVQGHEKLESNDIIKNLDEIVDNIQKRITDRNTKIGYYKVFCWLPTFITLILLLVKEREVFVNYLSVNLSISSPTIDHLYCAITGIIKVILSFF
jgi:hypothetical protein